MTKEEKDYLAKHRTNKLNPYMLHDGKPLPLDHPDSTIKKDHTGKVDEKLKGLLFHQAEEKARASKASEALPPLLPTLMKEMKAGKKHGAYGDPQRRQAEQKRKKKNAKGGYVKKYARGVGVLRKAR